VSNVPMMSISYWGLVTYQDVMQVPFLYARSHRDSGTSSTLLVFAVIVAALGGSGEVNGSRPLNPTLVSIALTFLSAPPQFTRTLWSCYL